MSEALNSCIGSMNYNDLNGQEYSLMDIETSNSLTFGKFTTKSLLKLEENDKLFSLSFNITGNVVVPIDKKLVTVKVPSFVWEIKIISSDYTNEPSVKIQVLYDGLYLSMNDEKEAVLTNRSGSAMTFVIIEPGKAFMTSMCFSGPTDKASGLTICQNYFYNYPDPKIVARFCTVASDIELPICQNYCKTNDCNNILENYCGIDGNKSSKYCSCFLGDDFYSNYGESLKNNGYSPLDTGSPYYYPNCMNSEYHVYDKNVPLDANCVLTANTTANGSLSSSILTRNVSECYNFLPKIPAIPRPAPIFIPENKKYKKKSELVIIIPVIAGFVLLMGVAMVAVVHKRSK